MHEKHLYCPDCSKTHPTRQPLFHCEGCGSSLEVVFDYDKIKRSLTREKLEKRPFSHSRYLELYPVGSLVSLGEGGTPLLRSRNVEKDFDLGFELWFKCEYQNPTGSFKDRGSSVEIARALESGARSLVCASTGNMGASVAAYSAAANLPCSVFIPKDAVSTKVRQILAYGARVNQVAADYTSAAEKVESLHRNKRGYLLGDYLYRREGTKSVGFEIAEQIKNPDYVVCPIGNGTLISAVWKAFCEFRTLGFLKTRPKMVGIQAAGCPPVARAFEKGSPIRPVKGRTVALAIACGDPLDGDRALRALLESKGFAGKVTDPEILKARDTLAKREGLFAEPAGAAALAGLLKYRGEIPRGKRVVCIVTGHGLKTPRTGTGGRVRKV